MVGAAAVFASGMIKGMTTVICPDCDRRMREVPLPGEQTLSETADSMIFVCPSCGREVGADEARYGIRPAHRHED